MTRPADSARPTRARARFRFGAIAGLAALFAGVLVTVAPAAHATVPCADPVACPVALDNGSMDAPFYSTPFNVKLTVKATPLDPAHDIGLMAKDQGPSTTKIEIDFSDTQSMNGATITYTNNLNGSFVYTPDPANPYSGIDQFDYCIIVSATGNDDCATAYIKVIATARNDVYGMRADSTLTVTAPLDATTGLPTSGLVANDSGIDPDSILLDATSAHGGTVTDNWDGAFQYTPPPGFHGADTFGYTGMDIDWDYEYAAVVTIYVDGTPPTITMSAPTAVTMGTKMTATWSGHDDQAVDNYDAQYQVANWNGPLGAAQWLLPPATKATTKTFSGTYGQTYCYRVRARDYAGNLSGWARRCTSIPLRARSLTYTGKWVRQASAAYFTGVAYRTNVTGQYARLTGVQGQHMWLVATKCPVCGTVQVRWNGAVIANVNLASPVTVHHALVGIANFPAPKLGELRLYVTSPATRTVIIEGLAVLRA
jgi:hypothetical protein